MSGNEMKCPKDGNPLVFTYESEKTSDAVKVVIYYKCPICGFRSSVESLEIVKAGQNLVVKKFLYGSS